MNIPLTKWDRRFILMALEVAKWSKDPNKQVGAILVSPDKRQVSWGYNGLPRGLDPTVEQALAITKAEKNALSAHAELNCILNSAVDITGWTIYVTEPPCTQCAVAIVQKGLYRLVCPQIKPESSWAKSQAQAFSLLASLNINITTYAREEKTDGDHS